MKSKKTYQVESQIEEYIAYQRVNPNFSEDKTDEIRDYMHSEWMNLKEEKLTPQEKFFLVTKRCEKTFSLESNCEPRDTDNSFFQYFSFVLGACMLIALSSLLAVMTSFLYYDHGNQLINNKTWMWLTLSFFICYLAITILLFSERVFIYSKRWYSPFMYGLFFTLVFSVSLWLKSYKLEYYPYASLMETMSKRVVYHLLPLAVALLWFLQSRRSKNKYNKPLATS